MLVRLNKISIDASGKSNKTPYVFLQSLFKSGIFASSKNNDEFGMNNSNIYLSDINPFILCKGSSGVTR